VKKRPVICIGAALIDETYTCMAEPRQGTSNPASYFRSPGGVARNIANHLALLGQSVEIITHFGSDQDGQWLMGKCSSNGIGISHSIVNDVATGRFVAMLSPEGDLFTGAVSTHFESQLTPAFLEQKIHLLKSASVLLIDTNLGKESLNWILQLCRLEKIPCIIEPVSVPKAARLRNADLSNILLITPNRDEMLALSGESDKLDTNQLIGHILERGVNNLWIRDGRNGSAIYSPGFSFKLAAPDVNVVETTGAGDAALAGWIYAWLQNKAPEECVGYGHAMAKLVLQVKGAIKTDLSQDLLETTFSEK
jgi:pseudouridine kinase